MARPAGSEPEAGHVGGCVPWSWQAAILAALGTGFILVGFTLVEVDRTAAQMSSAATVGIDSSTLVPMLIASSLWGGATAAASVVVVAHRILKYLSNTHPLAYAAGGAVVAGAYAWAVRSLGLDDAGQPLLIEMLAGATAGFLYRIFAGTRPK